MPADPPTNNLSQNNLIPSNLAKEIKQIFAKNPGDAEDRIESFLIDRLDHLAWPERIKRVQEVAAHLDQPPPPRQPPLRNDTPDETGIQNDIIAKLFPLLLGKKAAKTDLESKAQLEALAQALNTIFDTLNRLIAVINATLTGSSPSQEETIRGLIGQSVANQSSTSSMVAYLGQIEQAFLTSQKAMKTAVREVVDEILTELDPDTLGNSSMGPLRRKKRLNALKEKHDRCRSWFASSRFEERVQRAFEKSCHKHFGG